MITLIKSATIHDPYSPFNNQKKDILINDGIITEIASNITELGTYNIIAIENLQVSNGWFETSACFGEPGFEDSETIQNGLNVAAKSGFTSVAVNPKTNPVADNKATIQYIKNSALDHATELYPIGALTQQSKGKEMAEMFDMKEHGAIAFGDYKKPIENANLLKIALLYAQNFDGLVLSFPKDIRIAQEGVANEGINSTKLGLKGIPNLSEELQISRDLFLLEYTGGKLHIPTISTEKSVDLIRNAKKNGLNVSCSVTVENLTLTDDELHNFESKFKLSPPLRTKADQEALIKGVNDGTIDIITSDHTPINIEDKNVEFSIAKDGTIGLESAFGILQNIFDTETIIRCISENPRRIFSIEKTLIDIDKKANLSLFSTQETNTFKETDILSLSKNSAFIGHKIKGTVHGIFNNNKLVLKQQQ